MKALLFAAGFVLGVELALLVVESYDKGYKHAKKDLSHPVYEKAPEDRPCCADGSCEGLV